MQVFIYDAAGVTLGFTVPLRAEGKERGRNFELLVRYR